MRMQSKPSLMHALVASLKSKRYSNKKRKDLLIDSFKNILIARKDDESTYYSDVIIKEYYT